MKRIRYILAAVLLCLASGIRADNTVTVSSAEGAPGDEVTVSVSLTNSDAVSSLQVAIPLDENLTLVENSGETCSRSSGHSLTVGVKDGVLNLFLYSLTMSAIDGNSGEVAKFRLKLGAQPQTVSLNPSKSVLADVNGATVDNATEGGSVTTRCAKAQYSTMTVDFGEVPIRSTYRQTVTVTNVGNADLEITGMTFSDVNVFSSATSFPLNLGAGASAELDVSYAPVERGAISKTVKVECNSTSKLNTIVLQAQPFAVNELHIQPASGISDEEAIVSMTMNNMDDVSGYQVEFALPNQFEYVEGSFALSERKQDHVGVASLNGKALRLLVYSPSDKPLAGNDGEIGSFRVKLVGRYGAVLTPTKTVLSATVNNVVQNVVSEVYGGDISIQSPQISCDGELNFGAVSVTETCEKTLSIRNYGNAPLTVNRIIFNNEALSVMESLPIAIPVYGNVSVTVVCSSVEQTAFEGVMQIYSNDPDRRLTEVNVRGSRFAPNYVAVATGDVVLGDPLSIDFSASNYDAITGLQFDVVHPAAFEAFDGNVSLEERAPGMTVTMRRIDAVTDRYFCYNLSGSSIAAGEGKIMSIRYRSVGDVPLGEYVMSVTNILLGADKMENKYAGGNLESHFTLLPPVMNLNKTEMTLRAGTQEQLVATVLPKSAEESVTWMSSNPAVATVDENGLVTAVAAGTATITATTNDGTNLTATCEVTAEDPAIPGDVNGDGKINVTDVGMVIDHILEHTPAGFIAEAADINGDGIINVTDVGLIIDIILSDNSAREVLMTENVKKSVEEIHEPQ